MSIVIQQIYKSVSQCRIFYVDFPHTRVTLPESSQTGRWNEIGSCYHCLKQQHTFFLETSFTLLYCYNTSMKVSIQTLLLFRDPGRLQYLQTLAFATAVIHKKACCFIFASKEEEVIFACSMRMSCEHSHWSKPLCTDSLFLLADWSLYFVSPSN